MFDVDVSEPLFESSIPSMAISGANTPAFLCPAGVERMAHELVKYPLQLKVNLDALKKEYQKDAPVDLSGYLILSEAISKLII